MCPDEQTIENISAVQSQTHSPGPEALLTRVAVMALNMCVCVCVRVAVWVRAARQRGSVCGACQSVCVFSFKRRKTTVVTERSRKISYQIAEPTLVPRGLKAGSGVHH